MSRPLPTPRVVRSCLWRNLRRTGLERFELRRDSAGWSLAGTILLASDAGPAEARYEVVCDEAWRTERGWISLREADSERRLDFTVAGGRWLANGRLVPAVNDCVDVDLGWSPSTNTLPIRRLGLPVGGTSGPLDMAWVRFPELTLERLPQEYRRLAARHYRYTSRAGAFAADLEVDDEGVVVEYQGVWERVTEVR